VTAKQEAEEFVFVYDDDEMFTRVAKQWGIMGDVRADVPRASYKGVVQFRHRFGSVLHTVFLAPRSFV